MKALYRIDLIFSIVYILIVLSAGIFLSLVLRSYLPLLLAVVFAFFYGYFLSRKTFRRISAVRRAFPESWRRLLTERAYFYSKLPPEEKRIFENNLKIFLADFPVRGRRGFQPSREARLLAAAGVVTLLQGHPEWEPPTPDGILIYPGERFDEDYNPGRGNITGMAPYRGPMILSEKRILEDFVIPPPPFNVVYHETAHFFDWEDGRAEGFPLNRMPPGLEEEWMEVFENELERVRKGESILRDYAGTNAGELFAVATEVFFTTPFSMKKHHPRLFRILKLFYNLNPAAIFSGKSQKRL